MSACVVKPENRLLMTDPGATVELDTLPGHGRAMATSALRAGRAFPGLSARWQRCAADACSPRASRLLPSPGPWAGLQGAGSNCLRCSTGYRCCAWRVTTGLNPHYGADSDSVICVAPGVTVALANWPSLLEFFIFFYPFTK